MRKRQNHEFKNLGSSEPLSSCKVLEKRSELWERKYSAKSKEDISIQKDRLESFEGGLDAPSVKLMIVSGPSSSGKHSLLNIFPSKLYLHKHTWLIPTHADLHTQTQPQIHSKLKYKSLLSDSLPHVQLLIINHFHDFIQNVLMKKSNNPLKSRFVKRKVTQQPVQDRIELGVVENFPSFLLSSSVKQEIRIQFNKCIKTIATQCDGVHKKFVFILNADELTVEFTLRRYLDTQADAFFCSHYVKMIKLNPITTANIKKKLKHICALENISIQESKLLEIIDGCNNDLRNALNTLQFYHTKTSPAQIQQKKKRKKLEAKPAKDTEETLLNKDDKLNIFHALGKFLYNKRIKKGEQRPRQHSVRSMKDKSKVSLYFKPETVLQEVPVPPEVFTDYLHHNLIEFSNEIEDYSNILDDFSYVDALSTKTPYYYQESDLIGQAKYLHANIVGRSILYHNTSVTKVKSLFRFEKPSLYVKKEERRKILQSIEQFFVYYSECGLIEYHFGEGRRGDILTFLKYTNIFQNLDQISDLIQRMSQFNINPNGFKAPLPSISNEQEGCRMEHVMRKKKQEEDMKDGDYEEIETEDDSLS